MVRTWPHLVTSTHQLRTGEAAPERPLDRSLLGLLALKQSSKFGDLVETQHFSHLFAMSQPRQGLHGPLQIGSDDGTFCGICWLCVGHRVVGAYVPCHIGVPTHLRKWRISRKFFHGFFTSQKSNVFICWEGSLPFQSMEIPFLEKKHDHKNDGRRRFFLRPGYCGDGALKDEVHALGQLQTHTCSDAFFWGVINWAKVEKPKRHQQTKRKSCKLQREHIVTYSSCTFSLVRSSTTRSKNG